MKNQRTKNAWLKLFCKFVLIFTFLGLLLNIERRLMHPKKVIYGEGLNEYINHKNEYKQLQLNHGSKAKTIFFS